jgi:ribosomal protein S18 acetylase RimI-like enzyme
MLIRAATQSDCLAMAQLHAASWRFAYRGALSDEYLASDDLVSDRWRHWESLLATPAKHQHVFICEHDNQLIGFACMYGNENDQWGSFLNNIHVAQAAQGRGAGASLLHAIAELCTRLYGQVGLYLYVIQSNTNAQGFYARYGAKNVGTDVWHAPDGTVAPLFRFAWQSPRALQEATAKWHQ